MFLIIIVTAGFFRLAQRLGLNRFTVIWGLVAYPAGAIAVLIAAMINGFVVPALAEIVGHTKEIARLCWEFNQSLAYGSAIAISIAYFLWGIRLLNVSESFGRGLGVSGIVAGIVSATVLLTGVLDLDVSGATTVYAVQWAFAVATGLWLYKSPSEI